MAKWPAFCRKRWFVRTCVSIVVLLLITGIVLASVLILDEAAESDKDDFFDGTILPLVEQSLKEIEVFLEDVAAFHASVARTITATIALLDGVRQREAIQDITQLAAEGIQSGRNPALAWAWLPILTPATVDDAIQFKRMNGFPDFQIRPPGNRSLYVPFFFVFPRTPDNVAALGFDIWTNPLRQLAAIEARDSGTTAITSPLVLEIVASPRGVAFFTAVYQSDPANDRIEFDSPPLLSLRRELVNGYVSSALKVSGLFKRTLAQVSQVDEDEVDVCLFDKVQTGEPAVDEDLVAPNVTDFLGCWPDSELNRLKGDRGIENAAFAPLIESRWTAVRRIDALGRTWVALIAGKNLDPEGGIDSAAITAVVVMAILLLVLLIGGVFYARALKRTIASARAARKAAEDTANAKSAFLAHISHELRTPLNGVVGMIEVALADPVVPHRTRNNLKVAQDSATILLGIINDVLDFTKAETGNMQVESITFPVKSLVASTVRMHLLQARAKGIKLYLRIDRVVPVLVVSDPFRVRQILMNLLSNAVKFTDHGFVRVLCDVAPPHLEEEAETTELGVRPWTSSMELLQESPSGAWSDERVLTDSLSDELGSITDSSLDENESGTSEFSQASGTNLLLRFRVVDTGIGFTPEDGARLFSPFVQACVSTTRLYGGTGLGLPISSQLAALLGGRLTCSSRGPSHGACFELEIPVIVGSPADTVGTDVSAEPPPTLESFAGEDVSAPDSNISKRQCESDSDTRKDITAESGERTEPGRKTELDQGQDSRTEIRMLLVDDNTVNLKVFSMMLRDIGTIETAEDGQAAVDRCAEKIRQRGWPPYDIVLIDMSMPVLNGADATKEIRRMEEEHAIRGSKRLPVLLLSASKVPVDPLLFDGALWKPVRRHALRDAVLGHT